MRSRLRVLLDLAVLLLIGACLTVAALFVVAQVWGILAYPPR